MFGISLSVLIQFLFVLNGLVAAPLTIILSIIARIRHKNIEKYINSLYYYLSTSFFLILSFWIIKQHPTFFPDIIAFLNKINFTNYSSKFFLSLIMLITFIFIHFFAHYQSRVFNDKASLFLKYKPYCSRVSVIICLLGVFIAIYGLFLGELVYSISSTVIYLGFFSYAMFTFIEIRYKFNIFYVLEKLIQNLSLLDSNQQNKRSINEFTTDFRTFLNLLDKRLPKNFKINDFDLKIKEDQNIKYTINKYLITYILLGTKEQIVSIDKNLKEIKDILHETELQKIVLVRPKIINIYNDIYKFIQENKIKQHNDETGTFLNPIKNGKYSEIKNKIISIFTLIIIEFLLIVIEMVISGKLGSIFRHFNY